MPKPITKAELTSAYALRADISNKEANRLIDALIATISEQLVNGQAVLLPGLAKFETRERPARQVRNVRTGEMMDKAADRTVKISPVTGIKAAVNS